MLVRIAEPAECVASAIRELMVGQDTEEAEDSGYLVGYAAGLRDAARIMRGEAAREAGEAAS